MNKQTDVFFGCYALLHREIIHVKQHETYVFACFCFFDVLVECFTELSNIRKLELLNKLNRTMKKRVKKNYETHLVELVAVRRFVRAFAFA